MESFLRSFSRLPTILRAWYCIAVSEEPTRRRRLLLYALFLIDTCFKLPPFQNRWVNVRVNRWINLWYSAKFAEGATGCSFTASADVAIDALVFVGNLALVVGILVAMFMLHVAIVSAVEAYWLSKVSGSDLACGGCWASLFVRVVRYT